jgi:predicted metal-binding protein
MEIKMVRKIVERIPENQLQKDLEKYRHQAIELGATDAKIITTDQVLIDERVRAKCIYPKCFRYGTNANCPPYAMSLDETKILVGKFRYAIFIMLKVPSEAIAGKGVRDKKLTAPYRKKLAEITAKIEAEAFYDGHYFAVAFGNGSCKTLFCPETDCQALMPGKGCRHGLKSRSSMEAVGMDVFAMATKVGWPIYPIGPGTPTSEVPHGLRLSLVLIS